MQKLENAKIALSAAVAFSLTGVSTALFGQSDNVWAQFLAPVFGGLFGVASSVRVTSFILSFVSVRRFILQSDFVEGYWLLRTWKKTQDKEDDSFSPLQYLGVTQFKYDNSSGKFVVCTTRLDDAGNSFRVLSEEASFRKDGANLRYMNFFRVHYDESHARFGVAHGTFIPTDQENGGYDQVEIEIFDTASPVMRQLAKRIPSSQLKALQQHGSDDSWIEKYLRDLTTGQDHVEFLSRTAPLPPGNSL